MKSEKTIPLQDRSHTHYYVGKRTPQSASEEGSMTVEASMVIPLLLCAFLGILLWGKVFLFHQEMESALLETARQIARQEHFLSLKDQEGKGLLTAGALLKENRKQGDSIGGIELISLSLLGSEYREETKEICLKASYQLRIPTFLLGSFRLNQKVLVVQKAWNGYAPRKGQGTGNSRYVYMTDHGEVYHTDGQCWHLHVTVNTQKNTKPFYNGDTSYRPCEYCVSKTKKKTLYTTEYGECYHEDPACSGLTRTVKYVDIEKTKGRRVCVDCAKRK